MNVLLVDTDSDQADLLAYALRRDGHVVRTARDADTALRSLQGDRPDMVLLEVVLPRVDGFELCRRIRHQGLIPVILLTERSREADIIRGFDSGADDYVTKPFSPHELLARMKAVLRRYQSDAAQVKSKELCVGPLVFDIETHSVVRAGHPSQPVTRLEFTLLYQLALNVGQVVPYARLVESAWGYYDEESSILVKTHISHLRRKLGLPQLGPCSIRAVAGMGYRLAKA